MHETAEDVDRLQALIDRSYAAAGEHLLSIHRPERRLDAAALCERLTGMTLLVVATVTSDGRPLAGPVDGIFYRGSYYFGSSPDSVRLRHLAHRPWLSAVHLPSEQLAVTVHGRAEPVDHRAVEHAGFRRTLLDVYTPRYGPEWETEFLDQGPAYVRIDAERLFAFSAPELAGGPA